MNLNIDFMSGPIVLLTYKRQDRYVHIKSISGKVLLFVSLVFVCLMDPCKTLAQDANLIEISGQVYESLKSSPLSDVSVTVKGTVSGTITNSQGEFRLRTKTKLPFTLVFTSVGFQQQEL